MTKYELKYARPADPYKSLHRDGKVLKCLFNTRERECGDWCPKFSVEKMVSSVVDDVDFEVYHLDCCGDVAYDNRTE